MNSLPAEMKIFSTLAKNPWELDIEHTSQGAIPHENQSLFQISPQMIVAPTAFPPRAPPTPIAIRK